MGGLGHFAVMWAAKGMDAEVTVFSSSDAKKADAKEMGAKHYVNYSKDGWQKEAGEDFDLLLSTRDVAKGFPLDDFFELLGVHKRFITVGIPDDPLPGLPAAAYVSTGALFGGTHIGSKKEVRQSTRATDCPANTACTTSCRLTRCSRWLSTRTFAHTSRNCL